MRANAVQVFPIRFLVLAWPIRDCQIDNPVRVRLYSKADLVGQSTNRFRAPSRAAGCSPIPLLLRSQLDRSSAAKQSDFAE